LPRFNDAYDSPVHAPGCFISVECSHQSVAAMWIELKGAAKLLMQTKRGSY
jgi:hypothetical protein